MYRYTINEPTPDSMFPYKLKKEVDLNNLNEKLDLIHKLGILEDLVDFLFDDPDIDLGVLYDELPTDLHEKMADAGFQLHHQAYFKESNTVFEETYIYKKLHLDIFYYFKEGNDYYSVIARKHESKEWKEANATDGFPCDRSYVPICEFEKRDFKGIQIYMPTDTDGWLRAIYSDSYMTPIKNWNAKDYKTRIIHTTERSHRKTF